MRISRDLFLAAFGADLGGLESWVTDRLTSVLEQEDIGAGDTVFSVGETPDFFYFLREGRVQILDGHGPAWTLERRAVFGVTDVLLERARVRRAVALSDLQILKLPGEAWVELLDDSFPLARAAVTHLAGRVAALEERVLASRSHPPLPAVVAPRARPLNVVERLAALMDVPFLRGAGVQALNDLATVCDEVAFRPGEALLEPHTRADLVFLLVAGEVEASHTRPNVAWRGGAGEIVCGAAAFEEPVRPWSAYARTPTQALAFRVEDWFDLMEEHFDMVRSSLAALADRAERARARLALAGS
jgi:CRP-like cAMP-binding protein